MADNQKMDESKVNDEVFRFSFSTSRGIAFGALAESISLSMLNNSANHYASQSMGSSAMAATCAKILAS
ncbi:hypothetical protein FKG94_14255 [Exilibacterium tricleocarpae]|uniref:Uncharacterized protein n=1 Tax=Exilibacterium tricleocarpae TaxID=2591008 RepID=A0A545TLV6_9GAMM|nr:hypothetical protein [Exilibacterium tricleocarpae]TQV78227.1 hypothetical protein FKG94_14255 [Exilibacterium tricleocarpae]